MKTYLNNYINETDKLDFDDSIEVEGGSGTNYMSVQTIVDHILIAPRREQNKIRNVMVAIDFKNGNMMHFFQHLAQAIAT